MAFVLALLSSVLYGAADFMCGMASRRTHVFTATAASQAIGLVALLIAACCVPGATRSADLLWVVGPGSTAGVGVLLLDRGLALPPLTTPAPLLSRIARQRAQLSLVDTMVSLAAETRVLLAQLLLRERLRARQGAGVGLALGAIALLAEAR